MALFRLFRLLPTGRKAPTYCRQLLDSRCRIPDASWRLSGIWNHTIFNIMPPTNLLIFSTSPGVCLCAFERQYFLGQVMSGVICTAVDNKSIRTALEPSVYVSPSVYAYLTSKFREEHTMSLKSGTLLTS